MVGKTIVALILVGSMPLFIGPASAETHSDANDVSGPLDLKEVERKGVMLGGERHVKVTLRTYENFKSSDLYGGGFYTYFDSREGPRWDFRLAMQLWKDGTPLCEIYDRAGFSRGAGQVERGPASFSCTFPRSELNPRAGTIRWRSRSVNYSQIDKAPETGWYRD